MEKSEYYSKVIKVVTELTDVDETDILGCSRKTDVVDASWCVKPSIPIYLEYTRMLHKNVALRAGVFHDLAINETGFRLGVNTNIGW